MRPLDVQVIGNELAVKWDDGTETYLRLEAMRRYCPCAGCQGEVDVMGNLHKGPPVKLTPASYEIRQIAQIGGYALQPVWGDGHASGIYSFEYLRRVASQGKP